MNMIKTVEQEGVLSVSFRGRLEDPTVIMQLFHSLEGVEELHLDLQKLNSLSPMGLHALAAVQKYMRDHGKIVEYSLNGVMMKTFATSGFLFLF